MPDLLDRERQQSTLVTPGAASVGERGARAELRRQIGRLERELCGLVAEGLGRVGVPHRVAAAGPPRVLDLGALEEVRDSLAVRVGDARRALAERDAVEQANRELLAAMLAGPAAYRWLRVSRADLGLPGCGHWHSRPVLGPLGMLMGWWRTLALRRRATPCI